ncbi:MFS transporter [Planctomicrobium sp. SH664]|uniref:MFS transporter n=1 Tax=Planctomicrobium sp. SH664 TaxID=3448125 RepID=UPI003F5C1CA7
MSSTKPDHPPLSRDRSFWGMVTTQFLGAFNDNFYKQIVLLYCVERALTNRGENLQGIATILFAAPFILLSGYAGFLSDRYSKRTIVVLVKGLEIVVMAMGLVAFLVGNVYAMLAVLCLMGAHSALFGPSKYGILPELFPSQALPKVNGMVQMTTFLAIILGFTAAGMTKEKIGGELWMASVIAIGIALLGTMTSLLVRPTPPARPDLPFHISSLAVNSDTQRVIWSNKRLFFVLAATSLFWMAGGVIYPAAVNDLGRLQFQLTDSQTGQLAACTGIGIAIGCVIGGILSHNRFNAALVRWGCTGMFAGMILLGLPGERTGGTWLGVPGSALALVGLGICAGVFTVPLQVYLQARTPAAHKGRVIGAMNLANWIGICSSGAYYHLLNKVFTSRGWAPNTMFFAAALLILPIVLFYWPKSEQLNDSPEAVTPE